MTYNMHPKLQARLDEKEAIYKKVTAFAELLPMFESEIIYREYTGDHYHDLGTGYKGVYFAWGINYSTHEPTNYEGEYDGTPTISVYCNCISMFGDDLYSYANKKMHEAMQNVPMFHNDILNSTFYFELHQIENGLDAIVAWYDSVKAQGDIILKQKRKEELERQLKELEN